MLRALIIDDEAHIRDTLTKLLRLCCPRVDIVGEATGVANGIKKIQELHPDLVFLDINLKDGTGYDLIHALQPIGFKIIFISSFDQQAVQSFKLSSIAFMQKPFNPVELIEAIKQVENMKMKDITLCLEALEDNIRDFK
jgi:two-component system LytT family response regulator